MAEGQGTASSGAEYEDVAGDFAAVPVPQEHRRTFLNLFFVYSGVVAVIAAVFAGGALGLIHDFQTMVLAVFAGAVILAVIGSLTGYIGATTGVSTYVNVRYSFGRLGSWVVGVALITLTTGIGWFAFQSWFFGVIITIVLPVSVVTTIGAAALWGGLLMTTTAMKGYRGLSYLSYITVPGFVLLAIVGVWASIELAGGAAPLFEAQPPSQAPLAVGITATVGTYIAGAIITSDIARFARRAYHGSAAWSLQVLTLFPLLILAGGAMVLITGEANIAVAMAAAGMGIGVFLMAITGQWTTNDNNLYSGALAVSNFTKWRKAWITLVLGVIGSLYASYVGFTAQAAMEPFLDFIILLGKILPAMAGVYIADFYIVKPYLEGRRDPKDRYVFKPGTKLPEVNVAGIGALLVGALFGGVVAPLGLSALTAGTVLQLLFVIDAINALVVAVVVYLVLVGIAKALGVRYAVGEWTQTRTGL